jgi:hypothetical protein
MREFPLSGAAIVVLLATVPALADDTTAGGSSSPVETTVLRGTRPAASTPANPQVTWNCPYGYFFDDRSATCEPYSWNTPKRSPFPEWPGQSLR